MSIMFSIISCSRYIMVKFIVSFWFAIFILLSFPPEELLELLLGWLLEDEFGML